MNKNKKVWIILILLIIISLALLGKSSDYARIVDMDYRAEVVDTPGSEGKIIVTETITFDVHAASKNNGFWELWRDLCEDYIDGLKVYYNVLSVNQIMPDGRKVPWSESPRLYWEDWDYESSHPTLGPGKWFYSPGPYDESARRYEAIFFYIDDVYREKMTFEITYEMYNAVLRYGDCSDLYIAMYSGETSKYLESLNAEILIPDNKMPQVGNYKATTYGTNSGDFEFEESTTMNPGYHTFYFNLDEKDLKFRPHNEYIEFELVSFGEDKHKFSKYASKNDYYYDDVLDELFAEQKYYEIAPTIFMVLKIVILFACIVLAIRIINKGKKQSSSWREKFPFYSMELPTDTFRDIPSDLDPKFAAALVFSKDKKDNTKDDNSGVYSAILLSLARKGYIELEELSTTNVNIKIVELEAPQLPPELMEPIAVFDGDDFDWFAPAPPEPVETREPKTICEEYYWNLINRHATMGSITMSELQDRISVDYDYMSNFVENIDKSVVGTGVNLGYFQKANYLEPKQKLSSFARKTITRGFLITILVNLISYQTRLDLAFGGFVILGLAYLYTGYRIKSEAHKYVLLTELGEQEYNKWRGLYNFLKSDTLINERTVVELPLWEKYLVYATAFGISEKVIEAIKIRCPEVIEQTTSIVHNSYCRSGRFRSSGRSFHSSVRSGSFRSSSSGGGFSVGGGGRGGGGGGGGH